MEARQTDKSISYILSTLAIEGLSPSPEAIALCRKFSDGELSAEEAENAVFEKYGFYGVISNA